ncbi:MAG: DUF4157 domain-containing protein, partial [Candidatus Kapaibacterium sp.]
MHTLTRTQRRSSADTVRDEAGTRSMPAGKQPKAESLQSEQDARNPTGFAHDFSGVAVSGLAGRNSGDADTADAGHGGELNAGRTTRAPGLRLQRACACGGTCSGCRGREAGLEKEPRRVRRMRNHAGSDAVATVPPSVDDVLSSPGQSLDTSTRSFMESRFGHDFGRVRVHTNEAASRSAADIDARAWTVGDDIAFGSGQYNPQSPGGAGLLAHELTHVLQQKGADRSAESLELGAVDDPYEREAHANAAALATGEGGALASVPSTRVQRSFASGLLDVLLFIPRLFGLEVFLAEDLRDYLRGLRERSGPEGSLFGDNKARACVSRENELGPYDTQTKVWLVQEMLKGWTSGLDEGSIITLLRRSADRQQIVTTVGRDLIWSNFSGSNRRIVEALTLTSADAGDALVSRLRGLDPGDLQDYRANTTDPAVLDSIRRAAALMNITAPVPVNAAINAAGQADFVINGVSISVQPDRINPALGNHAFTHGDFHWTGWQEIPITPQSANVPVGGGAMTTDIRLS